MFAIKRVTAKFFSILRYGATGKLFPTNQPANAGFFVPVAFPATESSTDAF
jgi:hypothetical protein